MQQLFERVAGLDVHRDWNAPKIPDGCLGCFVVSVLLVRRVRWQR